MSNDSDFPSINKFNMNTRYNFDKNEIMKTFKIIQNNADSVHEIRILKATTLSYKKSHNIHGYFDNATKLISELAQIESAMGIYITPNPCIRTLLARRNNRLSYLGRDEGTKDSEVVNLNWLLLDFDPVRPSGISASPFELKAALSRTEDVIGFLKTKGFQDFLVGCSGNGGHGMARINLPLTDTSLVKSCLKALDEKFSDNVVKIDTSVWNSAQLWKLYGTLACKGDPFEDRVHRLAHVLSAPESFCVNPREVLEALAASTSSAGPPSDSEKRDKTTAKTAPPLPPAPENAFDIEGFIHQHQIQVEGPFPWEGGRRWEFNECPWRVGDGRTAFLIQFANGAISAGCLHDTCPGSHGSGNHWKDLRDMFEGGALNRDQALHGAELDAALARLPQTEFGLADRLRERHGNVCRYVEAWKAWCVFDGVRWVQSQCGAQDYAKDTIRRLQDEGRHLEENT